MIVENIIAAIAAASAGYLLGAIPTAYLLYRRDKGGDIRQEGTGNVGAHNMFDLTGSLPLSALVAIIDTLKGVAAVWLGYFFCS